MVVFSALCIVVIAVMGLLIVNLRSDYMDLESSCDAWRDTADRRNLELHEKTKEEISVRRKLYLAKSEIEDLKSKLSLALTNVDQRTKELLQERAEHDAVLNRIAQVISEHYRPQDCSIQVSQDIEVAA